MNIKAIKYLSIIFMIAVFSVLNLRAEGVGGNKAEVLNRTFGIPANTHFNINLISTWLYSDARGDINNAGNSGFVYPKGSNRAVFFQSGFIWGGRVQGEIRVGGTAYRTGMTPGWVENGVPVDPDDAAVRMYRVRPDWATGSMAAELADGDSPSDAACRAQYELDWNEWPADRGAPFEDVDGDGAYDPTVDIPGVPGADQTIWHVCNDFDPGQTDYLYGSLPMGLEVQYTFWGYSKTGALGSTMFRKYVMINKNLDGLDITDMYVSMWSDPDLGDASDDFAGCDTTLSLGYIYNANAIDAQYGSTPPAGGFDFFQGPIVPSTDPTSTGRFKGVDYPGMENLPMSAFYFFINSDPVYTDPRQGEYARGTLGFYNLFQGRISTTGQPFPVPDEAGGGTSNYCLSGDPVTQTGWIDGMQHAPGDRRFGQVAGPFTLAYGDTQEIVIAEMAAGAVGSINNIQAITILKTFDEVAQQAYDDYFVLPSAPLRPDVQVYEEDGAIVLDWGADPSIYTETETSYQKGYTFQGYIVYQLPSASATFEDAIRLTTFDRIDGIKSIIDSWFESESGQTLTEVTRWGTDSGIQRKMRITRDQITNAPLINGTRYYFAVCAYSYNPDPFAVPNTLENTLLIHTAIPQTLGPGERTYTTYGSSISSEHASGSGDATLVIDVVDPTATTGHEYEAFFDEQEYYMDIDGKWKKYVAPDNLGKRGAMDMSTAYLTGALMTSTTPGAADLTLTVNGVENSPDYNYADGVLMHLPHDIIIYNVVENSAGGGAITVDENTNVVLVGDSSRSTGGMFHGGGTETIVITISVPTLPMSIWYKIYDDGWAESDPAYAAYAALGGGIVDAEGSLTITEMGYAHKTQSEWNIRDLNTDEVVVEGQGIIAGAASWSGDTETYSLTMGPTFDGLTANFTTGSYELPIQILNTDGGGQGARLTGPEIDAAAGDYIINDYCQSGWSPAGAQAYLAYGAGTQDLDILQKDYELRFTGEYVDPNADIRYIADGTGSIATVYQSNTISNHPMNPNPGVNAPFTVRIPFEVWNVDDNQQVNMLFRDRIQTSTDRPFYAWNPNDRVYAFVLNTPYSETVIDRSDADLMSNLTWNWVFWRTRWVQGDVLRINYANPIRLGVDTWTFTAPAALTYDDALAKTDIAEEVNVFPNPYYGVNSQELNKYQRFVTFNHLPTTATIRIFNLAGQLVRTIEKTEPGQYQRWDLQNGAGLPVASGLYIAYIDMPDVGTTKILKVAIIQEQQILDRF